MTKNLNPTDCISYRLRRAARIAAKSYDRALKPAGLRNTQFTLLAALELEGAITIGDLADVLATDATTLNRNLHPLVREGWVENTDGEDGRVRLIQLTKSGREKYLEALPLWQANQKTIVTDLGQDQWEETRNKLTKIEERCMS